MLLTSREINSLGFLLHQPIHNYISHLCEPWWCSFKFQWQPLNPEICIKLSRSFWWISKLWLNNYTERYELEKCVSKIDWRVGKVYLSLLLDQLSSKSTALVFDSSRKRSVFMTTRVTSIMSKSIFRGIPWNCQVRSFIRILISNRFLMKKLSKV